MTGEAANEAANEAADEAKAAAVYLHWPYCRRICPYCDFNVYRRAGEEESRRTLNALLGEIAYWRKVLGKRRIAHIFFGGGTPSLLPPSHLAALLAALDKPPWRISKSAEITLEANPEDCARSYLTAARAEGINRLSLGVQALDDASLKKLGRRHTAAQARAALVLAAALMPRFSFDLIYARPQQTPAQWQAELKEALALAGSHISLYQLTYEARTPFGRAIRRRLWQKPDEDASAQFYQLSRAVAGDYGFPAYEISNHARANKGESKERNKGQYNLWCWRGGEYIGLGAGAHGRVFIAGQWQASRNLRQPKRWREAIAARGHGLALCSPLSAAALAQEALLTGLRLAEGVALERVKPVISLDRLALLQQQNLIRQRGGRLQTSAAGFALADRLALELLA